MQLTRTWPPALLLLLLPLLTAGCASPWKKECVYSESPIFLYVEREVRDGTIEPQGFDHPIQLDVDQVERLLSPLVHESRHFFWEAPQTEAVFRPQEVEALSRPLSRELASLGPDERLRLLTTRNSPESFQAKYDAVYGVSGVIFRTADSTLHLAFSALGDPVNEGDGGRPEDMQFDDPLGEYPTLGILPGQGARHHRDGDGKIQRRWIEIDLPTALAASKPPPAPVEGERPAPAEETKEPPSGSTPDGGWPATNDEEYRRLKEKVGRLKRLRDEGAITEEEYQREFDDLMDEL